MKRRLAHAADLVAPVGAVRHEVAAQPPPPPVDARAVRALVVALHEERPPLAARLARLPII